MGGRIYDPYSGLPFARPTETDIEHIVARAETHDSWLCAAAKFGAMHPFANDLLNITLASTELNRGAKNDRDAASCAVPESMLVCQPRPFRAVVRLDN